MRQMRNLRRSGSLTINFQVIGFILRKIIHERSRITLPFRYHHRLVIIFILCVPQHDHIGYQSTRLPCFWKDANHGTQHPTPGNLISMNNIWHMNTVRLETGKFRNFQSLFCCQAQWKGIIIAHPPSPFDVGHSEPSPKTSSIIGVNIEIYEFLIKHFEITVFHGVLFSEDYGVPSSSLPGCFPCFEELMVA